MFHFHQYSLKQSDRDGNTWHMTRLLEECKCGKLRIVSVPGWWYLDDKSKEPQFSEPEVKTVKVRLDRLFRHEEV